MTLRARMLPLAIAAAMVLPVAAESADEEDDGFFKIREVKDNEPWDAGVLETILKELDFNVRYFKYENPGPHKLKLSASLYIDHDEQNPISQGSFTHRMNTDDPELTVAAIIRDTDDRLTITLRTPQADVTSRVREENMPKETKFAKSWDMRHLVQEGVKTPIFCYYRTNESDQRAVFGRSDSNAIAIYNWIIIVYLEVTPMKLRTKSNAP